MRWFQNRWPGLAARKPAPVALPALAHRFEIAAVHDIGSTIEFRRDSATTLMVALFGALCLFIACGLWFGSFSKQETMRGYVTAESGAGRMTATVSGVVTRIFVAQGDRVTAGQKLLTISPQQSSGGTVSLNQTDIGALEATRVNLVQELDRGAALLARDAADRDQFTSDAASLRATLTEQVRVVERALADQNEVVEKFKRYLKSGYATRQDLTLQERTRVEYMRQLADTRAQLAQLGTTGTERMRALEQSSAQTANARSEVQSKIHDIDAKIQRMRAEIATDILAPADGQVAAINVREGAVADFGQVVAALADPDAAIRIALEAPSRAVGLIAAGQRVVLKYDSFPFKTFGVQYGKVVSVGQSPLVLPKSLDSAAPADPRKPPPQSTFLVDVEPERSTIEAYGTARRILVGSTLSADIVVERRRLIEWVLDPILAMRGRL